MTPATSPGGGPREPGPAPRPRPSDRPGQAIGDGAWIVLPTYNEAENLERIVAAVFDAAPEVGGMLIVDDASPDGTGEIADRLAAADGRIEVLHRAGKAGLGPAYVAGFQRVLAGDAGLVVQMDADFSHDPSEIPGLVAAACDADVAIGSRYVAGGSIPEWGVLRRLVSRVGCRYARTVLQVPVRDLTGGFKCFRRPVLDRLSLADVQTEGYGFQIEVTYRALRAGFSIAEVPIAFGARRAGHSKMSARIVAEALWKVPALRVRLATSRWPFPQPEGGGAW
jgi:dolichol-phosphate mannosyltransferase